MQQAIDLSREKMRENCGGPFGAVIVKNGHIIAEGFNQVTSTNDPTAHAEMVAIRRACQAVEDFNLDGCAIYTSCEPCPMCLSAIYWAGLSHIYYANDRADAEAIDFSDAHIYREVALPIDARAIPMQQLLHKEAQDVFNEWQQKTDKTPY